LFPHIRTDVSHLNITRVVIAAGQSTRFGSENKLLVSVNGKQIIKQVVETVCSILSEVVVVIDHQSGKIRDALSEYLIQFNKNKNYCDGQATSIATAIKVVSSPDAVLFVLGDMPYVQEGTIALLLRAFKSGVGDPISPAYKGQRGNPVIFAHQHFDSLRGVAGDVGGRPIFELAPDTTVVSTGDSGVLRDIDTKNDI
jgi:molybdenum cofactor cytidylyltransferase